MNRDRKYPSKVLLFGEYSVISGGNALAVPYRNFHISLEPTRPVIPDLSPLIDFWKDKDIKLDYKKLLEDHRKGLSLKSTIPLRSGLGSSGAVVAAIYDIYSLSKSNDLEDLKETFALMESYFHGKSSGFDPLVSYLDSPVVLYDHRLLKLSSLSLFPNIYLWNSQIPRNTSELVKRFMNDMENPAYKELVNSKYLEANNSLIENVLEGNQIKHEDYMDLSKLQFDLFKKMIPQSAGVLWKKGLDSGEYAMKLCGAGGGGFFLLFSFKPESIENIDDLYHLDAFISETGNINLPSH